MNMESVILEAAEVRKLLASASGDGALLYIYLKAGNPAENAAQALNLTAARYNCAMATLRQLGLWQEDTGKRVIVGERPVYTEQDVLSADSGDEEFKSLRGEVERLLGRPLNTEELKILLGFIRYLGMPGELISVLICFCKERARQRGSLRNPSLRTIEKEAYAWSEMGIDNLEEAAAFIQSQNVKNSRMGRLKEQLQIRGRSLTAAEERYASGWLEMGFADDAIAMAYERTCLNTGGLNWAYMNKILQRWHEAGLHTASAIENGDRRTTAPRGAGGELGQAERAAIQRMLSEV